MNLRAIYLPDLAFNPKEGNTIFEYDININKFKMIIDKEIQYNLNDVIEDENFIVFTTNIICDSWYPYDKEHTIESGEVNIINKKDINNIIKNIYEIKKGE